MGPGTRFYFQHHARPHGAGTLSLFDDGGAPPQIEKQSRAILLDLDTSAMTATLRRQYLHPAGVAAANQGSMQVLPDGRVFVGWGNEPYFSEFAEDGQIRLDGRVPGERPVLPGLHRRVARPPGRAAGGGRPGQPGRGQRRVRELEWCYRGGRLGRPRRAGI